MSGDVGFYYLEYDGRSWFELLDSRDTDRFEHRIWEVDEAGVVEGQHGLNVVQDEAELIRSFWHFFLSARTVGKLRGHALHNGGTQHLTRLEETNVDDDKTEVQ